MSDTESEGPSLDDVRAAAAVLEGVAHRTPVLRSATLDAAAGAKVWVKAECFQRTGSFKFRGAYNFLASLTDAQRSRGVCTVSSGNHAQAVALAARLLNVQATILMPQDAPSAKVEATIGYGARVVTYDRYAMPQHEAGRLFQERSGSEFVPAFDDARIVAGAGTLALELWEQAGPLDVIVVPVGGGGAAAGCGVVLKALKPDTRVVAVEPTAAGAVGRSLRSGKLVETEVPRTIADGQALTTPGTLTFELMRRTVEEVVAVSDRQLIEAMAFAFNRLKIVTEPSGASGVAAVLAGELPELRGHDVGVVVSGGNIGTDRFAELMTPTNVAP